VWALIAAYERDPEWRTGVTSMTPDQPGPLAPGSTTVEVMRFGGRTYRNVGEILEVLPGRSVAWRTTAGAEASGRRSVEPGADGSCDVTLELTVRPHGIERLLAPVLSRMLARNLDRDLANLERLVIASHRSAVAISESPN
jgi:hypothetical protein